MEFGCRWDQTAARPTHRARHDSSAATADTPPPVNTHPSPARPVHVDVREGVQKANEGSRLCFSRKRQRSAERGGVAPAAAKTKESDLRSRFRLPICRVARKKNPSTDPRDASGWNSDALFFLTRGRKTCYPRLGTDARTLWCRYNAIAGGCRCRQARRAVRLTDGCTLAAYAGPMCARRDTQCTAA